MSIILTDTEQHIVEAHFEADLQMIPWTIEGMLDVLDDEFYEDHIAFLAHDATVFPERECKHDDRPDVRWDTWMKTAEGAWVRMVVFLTYAQHTVMSSKPEINTYAHFPLSCESESGWIDANKWTDALPLAEALTTSQDDITKLIESRLG